ncbi:M48 family metallopeptidase [Roseovarius sp. D22-M7]|uniref:M48 family metallopeptidase n=1 Tax=Roseovarius sp. D22-M7 TaxID=3127116 RepID=UPI0030105A0D
MSQHFLPGDPPVALTLRHSPRARRVSLRVSGLDGRVTLSVPRGMSEAEALEFARSKAGWLRAQLARQPGCEPVRPGLELPFEGRMLRIAPGAGRAVRLGEGALHVPGPEARVAARLEGWLKARARDRLAQASDHYAARLGRRYSRITLRDTRSRWGSCSSKAALSYSWRLIMAPPEVLDYVAAHEVAHLVEMNHSPAFWAVVAQLFPAHDGPRQWLRQEGAGLHRYVFGD